MLPTYLIEAIPVVVDVFTVVPVPGPLRTVEVVGVAVVTHDVGVRSVSSEIKGVVLTVVTGTC